MPIINAGGSTNEPPPEPDAPWQGRVSSARVAGREIKFRPKQILVRSMDPVRLTTALDQYGLTPKPLIDAWWTVEVNEGQEVYWADRLRADGFRAEVNHVMFTDPGWAHPGWAHPGWAHPGWAHPGYAHPGFAHSEFDLDMPVMPNLILGNPIPYSAYEQTGVRPSWARPSTAPPPCPKPPAVPASGSGKVWIYDTGFANSYLVARGVKGDPETVPVSGTYLDPVAGHGTFIAGLVELIGHPAEVHVEKVVTSFGDVDVAAAGFRIGTLAATSPSLSDTIISLSFGSEMDENPNLSFLGEMIRTAQADGAVVVASAGNDGSQRRRYPAAFRDVVAVGGLGPYGPAPTTNYGRWVRACAPSTDVVSTFFENFNGPIPAPDVMGDPDHFSGWATWSGTSFAVPIVVAALVREMTRCQCNAKDAVEKVIDDPSLYRIPGLGTVINLTLGSAAPLLPA